MMYSIEQKMESEEILMNQHPEIKAPVDDKYAGMELQELPFAVLENNYGQMETYRLDVISSPEKADTPRPVVRPRRWIYEES